MLKHQTRAREIDHHVTTYHLPDISWRMVLFVKSSATRPSIRESLRRTWPSLSYVDGAKFAAIFLIGKASKKYEALIAEESKRYGDILLLNVSDDYR